MDEMETMRALILAQQSMITTYESILDFFDQTLYQIGNDFTPIIGDKKFGYGIMVSDIKKLLLDNNNQLFDDITMDVFDMSKPPINPVSADQYKAEAVMADLCNINYPTYYYRYFVNGYNIVWYSENTYLISLDRTKSYTRDINHYNIAGVTGLIGTCKNLCNQGRLDAIKPILY